MEKRPGTNRMEVTDTLRLACSNMAFFGDKLYYYATGWNEMSLPTSPSSFITLGFFSA